VYVITLAVCVPKTPKLAPQLGRARPKTDRHELARTNARTEKPEPTFANEATESFPLKRPSERIDRQLASCTAAKTLTPFTAVTLVRAPNIES
jgi:hypothetical protein